MTRADQVPGSLREITTEWLTAVLVQPGSEAEIIGFEYGDGSRGSHERRQLFLRYAGTGSDELPRSVFTKTLPSLRTRMLVGYLGHARFEQLFYQRIRPQLTIETPLGYHSASERSTLAAVHVLEDLSATKNATFCDHTSDIDRRRAEGS